MNDKVVKGVALFLALVMIVTFFSVLLYLK